MLVLPRSRGTAVGAVGAALAAVAIFPWSTFAATSSAPAFTCTTVVRQSRRFGY